MTHRLSLLMTSPLVATLVAAALWGAQPRLARAAPGPVPSGAPAPPTTTAPAPPPPRAPAPPLATSPRGAGAEEGDEGVETCASVGAPSRGWLAHPVALAASERLTVRPGRNWGCPELVDGLRAAIDRVWERFPGTYPLVVGDLSHKHGGRFRPHKSHQSGRDVDVGYYLRQRRSPTVFKKATRRTLDAARTWTLLEGLLEGGELEYAFIDRRLQRALYEYARDVAHTPRAKLDRYFQYPRSSAKRLGIIRHLRGHRNHMHLRFRAPRAVAAGEALLRAHPELAKPAPVYYRVRRGDSLSRIARRHHLSVKTLRRWNSLRRRSLIKPRDRLIVGWRRPKLPG